MRRQAPGRVRLEHAILQYELLRVGPVVRNFSCVVVPHYVRFLVRATTGGIELVVTPLLATLMLLLNEAVHLTFVYVAFGILSAVWTTAIEVLRVVERLDALFGLGVRYTNHRNTVLHRYAVCTRVRAEVVVEGAVLLHDHYDVLDLMELVGYARSWHRRLCPLVEAATTASDQNR